MILTAVAILLIAAVLSGDATGELWQYLRKGDEHGIVGLLRQEGWWQSILSVFLLCVLQIISVVLPGAVVHIAAGIIYPILTAFLVCYLGFAAGHALVFYIVRAVLRREQRQDESHRRPEDLIPEKYRNSWLIRKMQQANPILVTMLSCFMPGLPNGIIPHIAARTEITLRQYTLAILLSSWLQILCSCVAGHFFIRENYLISVLFILLQWIVVWIVAKERGAILEKFPKQGRK